MGEGEKLLLFPAQCIGKESGVWEGRKRVTGRIFKERGELVDCIRKKERREFFHS